LPNKTRFYYAKKALMTIAKMAANKASLSIYNFTANANGASNVQPLGLVVNTPLAANPEDNTLNSSYVNTVNNMGTFTYSPLAEGLASIGGYYGSASSHVVGYYCQKNFAIVVSPGLSSEDQSRLPDLPQFIFGFDNDNSGVMRVSAKDTSKKIQPYMPFPRIKMELPGWMMSLVTYIRTTLSVTNRGFKMSGRIPSVSWG
jgi:hypothetical protein